MKISIQSYKDQGTVVLDSSLIDQLTRGHIIDAPITLLRKEPPLWLLPTAMLQNQGLFLSHTLLKGYFDNLSDAEYAVMNEHELFSIPEHLKDRNNGRHWITNLYHDEDGVLAFIHSEYAGENDFFRMPGIEFEGIVRKAPGRSVISLAWLPKNRLDADNFQFNYLGHIATYCSDVPHFNVSGTPIFTNDEDGVEYLNILFTNLHASLSPNGWKKKKGFVSQARAPLKDVLLGAKAGNLTPWLKRNGSKWGDSMQKGSTGILPKVEHADSRIANGEVIVHSDVSYIADIKKYILVAYVLVNEDHPSCLVIYTSDDGLDWKFETTANERTDCKTGWSYITMLNEGRRNHDSSLYLLVGWDYGQDERSVYRLKLDIS